MPRIHIPFLYPEATGFTEERCREEGRKALALARDKLRPGKLGNAPALIAPRDMIQALGVRILSEARGPHELDLEVWGQNDVDLHCTVWQMNEGELTADQLRAVGHYWLHYLCVRERFMDGKGLQIITDKSHFGAPDAQTHLEAVWFAEELALPADTLRAAVAKYGAEDAPILFHRHGTLAQIRRRMAQLGLTPRQNAELEAAH